MVLEIVLDKSNSSCYENVLKRSDDFFEKLYLEYKDRINYLVRSKIKKTSDAEDIVQDVFMKIWEFRNRIEKGKPVKALLYRITTNQVYNYHRHEEVVWKYEQYLSSISSTITNTTNSILYLKEIESIIEEVIYKLPKRQKEIFEMYWEKDLSCPEIAMEKGISIRTVENQVYRVKRRIKEEIARWDIYNV